MEPKKFINPYNFIPLPQKKREAYKEQDQHTGVITYQITTKTPLFIPNTSNDNAFLLEDGNKDEKERHKNYDFFSYHELEQNKDHSKCPKEPVIPGSEIRGVIRSIYETLTDSCMGVFNDKLYPKRKNRDAFHPGLLRREKVSGKVQYQLYHAEGYQYSAAFGNNELEKYPEGSLVFFKSVKEKRLTEDGLAKDVDRNKSLSRDAKGYLVKGGVLKSNHYVFRSPKPNAKAEAILDEQAIKDLKEVLSFYQSQMTKTEAGCQEYQERLEAFLEGKGEEYFPVRYFFIKNDKKQSEKQTELRCLSPAVITKELVDRHLEKMFKKFATCEVYAHHCPACDLFGMTGKDHDEAIGSKVRFSDATVQERSSNAKDYYDPIITRETLAEPRFTNPEFYLEQPEGSKTWGYDHYVKDQKLYMYTEDHPLKLRGRKYYVHQPDVEFPENVEPTHLNITIRPVTRNVRFEGKVYFEKTSQKQIDQLIWILNGGSSEERKDGYQLWYKLGGGKPLGFGSVELKVLSCIERKITLDDKNETFHYKSDDWTIKNKSYEDNQFSVSVKEDFVKIHTYDYAKSSEVTYPSVAGGTVIGTTVEKGYEWFQENRKREKRAVLPSVAEKYLEQYEVKKK